MNPITGILYPPITTVLVAIYQFLSFLHIPYALGFSIIILTVIIRLILSPLTASQLKTTRKMQKITPHINRLKETHKNDAKRLQEETMKLYKEHGVNPAAGCLPVLLQLPIIWGLYGVLQLVVNVKSAELVKTVNSFIYPLFSSVKLHSAWDTHFFSLSLGQSPSTLLSSVGVLILLFPIATGVFQFLQSKMMFTPNTDEENNKQLAVKEQPSSAKATAGKKDDFASAMQAQSMYIFPLMIGFFSYTLPLGLSLYWNTFTIFGIIQQYQIQGWGGLQDWIDKLKGK